MASGRKEKSDKKRLGRWPGGLKWIAAILIWLAVWQILYLRIDQEIILVSPLQVIARIGALVLMPSFWHTAGFSLGRIVIGFSLGVLAGSLLAVGMVKFSALHTLFYPLISAIRATPVASFIILALIWMSSNRVVMFIVFLMVVPIVWGNVAEGIRKTEPQLLQMARVFGLGRGQVVRYIYVPSIMPFFTTAAVTSLGLGWKAGIAAEVLSTPAFSLGGRLYESKIYLNTLDLMAFTVVIILLSLLLERGMLRLLRHAQRYFERHGRRREDDDGHQAESA